MERTHRVALLSIGGILDRYIARGFIKIFVISLACTTVLYLIVDFFDRIDNLLQAGASLGTSARYFFFKAPLLISRVFAFAALFSTLFSLGMMCRTQEITAMRSSGLSLRRMSLPLFLLSFLLCIFTFFWNEALLPIFARKAQHIYKVEVKKSQPRNIVGTKDIWIRGQGTFISIDHFDPRKMVLEGVSIYFLDRDSTLRGLIEVPWARWDGARWETKGGSEWIFSPSDQMSRRDLDAPLPVTETPEDFKLLAREPEELSFFDLRKQIVDLKAKGFDTTPDEVDLQVKLALPLVSPLMVLLGIPFALKQRSGGGMALSFGVTMLIGFGYWLVLAFSVSLGHSGALPPLVAAWLPNLTLALVGLFFSTEEE